MKMGVVLFDESKIIVFSLSENIWYICIRDIVVVYIQVIIEIFEYFFCKERLFYFYLFQKKKFRMKRENWIAFWDFGIRGLMF